MSLPNKILLSNFLYHHVRCDKGLDHGPGLCVWMHPPVHRVLGWISKPSSLRLDREVWRLDQLKGMNQKEVYVKGDFSISDQQTLDRFPTLINAQVFNKSGKKIGLLADLIFEPKKGKIYFYLVSRTNPLIPGTSRWKLSISEIIDKQPGSISCNIDTLEDLPIYKASLREEFLSKSRKWKNQFQDLTDKASDRLEGWIDEQTSEGSTDFFDDLNSSNGSGYSYSDWIDNENIDSSEEFYRIKQNKKTRNSTNDRDTDPWI